MASANRAGGHVSASETDQDFLVDDSGTSKVSSLLSLGTASTVCLVASLWPLKAEFEGVTLKEHVVNAAHSLRTRAMKVIKPSTKIQNSKNSRNISSLT